MTDMIALLEEIARSEIALFPVAEAVFEFRRSEGEDADALKALIERIIRDYLDGRDPPPAGVPTR